MKRLIWLSLLLVGMWSFGAGTAHAQGPSDDRFCIGRNNETIEAGQQVRNLIVIGCNASIREGATVREDTTVFGGNISVEKGARIGQDLSIIGGNATVSGEIGNDIAILGGNVSLLDGAVVGGNVRIASGNLKRADGAVVKGGVSEGAAPRIRLPRSLPSPINPPSFISPFNGDADFGGGILGVLAMAALGVLVAALAPVGLQRVAGTAQNAMGMSAGIGCLSLIALPVILIALAITLIGIPVAALVGLAAAAAWYFGWIAIGYLVGTRLLDALRAGATVPVLATLFGVVLLAVVGNVPCLGGLITLLVGTVGLGAVLLTRFGTRAYPPYGGTSLVPVAPVAPIAPATRAEEPPPTPFAGEAPPMPRADEPPPL